MLNWLNDRILIGVPLSRAIRDANIAMTRPTVSTLLEWYNVYKAQPEVTTQIESSLFPAWLDQASTNPQQNPDNCFYVGRFPWGEWQYDENN